MVLNRMRTILATALLLFVSLPLAAMKGFVYGDDGKPVAGAKVSAHVPSTPDRTLARLTDPSIAGSAPLASVTTDPTGAFRLDATGAETAIVAVGADGYLPWRSLEVTADEEITISLRRATARTGRIHSANRPVKDALVSFLDNNYEVLASYRTDADGSYSAPDAFGWASSFCVTHPDYAPACQGTNTEAGPASADVALHQGKAVTGRVVDENGKAVPGAVVKADHWTLARASEDGTFAIAHAPESAKLHASAGGRAGVSPMLANATIRLAAARALTGTVTNAKGRALAGVPVMTSGSSAGVWLGTITDAKGAYTFSPLAADQYTVGVNPPLSWQSAPVEIDLRRGDGKKNLVVRDAPFVRGTVVDESKKAVEGAVVTLTPKDMPVLYGRFTQFPFTTSGSGGRFRLRLWDESGEQFRLMALKPGYAAGSAAIDQTRRVSITLPAGVEITGVVVDGEGKPQEGASVVAAEATQMLNAMPLGGAVSSGTLSEWTRTGADGRFAMQVNTGEYDFSAWKQGYAAADAGSVKVNAQTEPLRIALVRAAEIRGRVLKSDGSAPAGGVVVAMRAGQSGAGQATLGADGSFVFDSLAVGAYTLSVQSEDGSATKTVTAPARDVLIELPALTPVRGRVTDKATGAAVQQFTVVTSNTAAQHYGRNEVAEESGAYTSNVPGGSTEIEISAPGFTKVERTVTVVASKPLDGIDFALDRGRRLTGRVTASDGTALDQATVTIGEEQYSGETAATAEDGTFELEGVAVTGVVLSVRRVGYLTTATKVAAGADDQRVDVTLSHGRKLSGRVLDASGAGVAEAGISASSQVHGAEAQTTTTAADGSFTLTGLIEAHYDIEAQKEGAGEASLADIDVKTTKPVVLRLVSKPKGAIHGTVAGAARGDWMMGMVHARSENGMASAQIQRDGTYRIENVPAGEVTVAAVLTAADRESTSSKTVTLPPGADIEVHLAATGNITINGRVTSEGRPIPSQSVAFGSASGYGRWRITTAEDGTYQISGLEPGSYWVQVGQHNAPDYYQTQYEVTGSTTYDINITRTKVEGRVVDDAGTAVAGAVVSATPAEGERSGALGASTTDASGGFTLSVYGDRSYQLTAAKRGFVDGAARVDGRSAMSGVVITLRHGEGQTIKLVDARSGATLTGYVVVTDETGKVTFPVSPEKQSDGSLHIALPDGRYRISASASEYASRTVRATVPSSEIKMSLTRGGTLIVNAPTDARHLVRLVTPDGEEYVRCYCNGIAEIRLEGATTKVSNVAAAFYRMDLLDTAGAVVRSYPVTITEGQTATVDATK